jgi:hypothetical protein
MSLESPPTLRQKMITLLIGVVGFIAIPVLVTALVPVTWIALERSADAQVSATAYRCVLFVLPWRQQRVEAVHEVASAVVRSDRVVRQKSHGNDKGYVNTDGVDELIVQGRDGDLTVAISPASSDAVTAKALAFLRDPSQRKTHLFVIANWKFGLGMGLPLTLAAWLYIVSSLFAGVRALYRNV